MLFLPPSGMFIAMPTSSSSDSLKIGGKSWLRDMLQTFVFCRFNTVWHESEGIIVLKEVYVSTWFVLYSNLSESRDSTDSIDSAYSLLFSSGKLEISSALPSEIISWMGVLMRIPEISLKASLSDELQQLSVSLSVENPWFWRKFWISNLFRNPTQMSAIPKRRSKFDFCWGIFLGFCGDFCDDFYQR